MQYFLSTEQPTILSMRLKILKKQTFATTTVIARTLNSIEHQKSEKTWFRARFLGIFASKSTGNLILTYLALWIFKIGPMVPKLDEIWSGAFIVKTGKSLVFYLPNYFHFSLQINVSALERHTYKKWKCEIILFYNYNTMNPFKHGSKGTTKNLLKMMIRSSNFPQCNI